MYHLFIYVTSFIEEMPEEIPEGDLPDKCRSRTRRARLEGRFFAGPMLWSLIDKADALPGKCLRVLMIILDQHTLRGKPEWVGVNQRYLADSHGVERRAFHRAVLNLESAQILKVRRRPGCALEVKLCHLLPPKLRERKGPKRLL
jgi:hypothetical protein